MKQGERPTGCTPVNPSVDVGASIPLKNNVTDKEKDVSEVLEVKYAIQLAALTSQAEANQISSIFTKEGYAVLIFPFIKESRTYYRVQVVGFKNVVDFPDKVSASNMQSKMKTRYTKNPNVQNSFVIKLEPI